MPRTPLEKLAALPDTHQELFLAIASEFAEIEPWTSCPPDVPLGVRVPTLGLEDGRIIVIGQADEAYGFVLFYDAFSMRRLSDIVGDVPGSEARLPRYATLRYELHTADDPQQVLLIPTLGVVEQGEERAPDRHELDQLLAVTAGVTRFFDERGESRQLTLAWSGGPAVECTHHAELDGALIDVSVRAPAIGAKL